MSADSNEVEFEEVTTPKSPAKRPAAKVSEPKPVSEDDLRAKIEAEVRARIEAETRARIEAEVRAEIEQEKEEEFVDLEFPDETPVVHLTPGHGEVLIHFVDDGCTIGPKIYMRGEEAVVNPQENPWVNYTRAQQIKKFGKHLYARGPWPYGGYDLTDPELTPEAKARLLALSKRR